MNESDRKAFEEAYTTITFGERREQIAIKMFNEGLAARDHYRKDVAELVEAVLDAKMAEDDHRSQEAHEHLSEAAKIAAKLKNLS